LARNEMTLIGFPSPPLDHRVVHVGKAAVTYSLESSYLANLSKICKTPS